MSLINDALKRARQAQDTAPKPEEAIPHLRPVESAPSGLRGAGLVLPVVLTLVALGGLFFLWQATPKNIPAQAAAARPEPHAAAGPVGTLSTAAPSLAQEKRRSEARPDQEDTVAPSPSVTASNAPATVAASTATNAPAVPAVPLSAESALVAAAGVTNLPAAVPPPPAAKPALPRLQAIVFNPTRPSAIIGGKTLFIGDRLGEYRVLTIQPASATLASTTHTNVLTLSE